MSVSMVSAIEQLLLVADCDDVHALSIEVEQIAGQIKTILVAVNTALGNVGNDPAVRADLEEIRNAAVRAIMKVQPPAIIYANDAA